MELVFKLCLIELLHQQLIETQQLVILADGNVIESRRRLCLPGELCLDVSIDINALKLQIERRRTGLEVEQESPCLAQAVIVAMGTADHQLPVLIVEHVGSLSREEADIIEQVRMIGRNIDGMQAA